MPEPWREGTEALLGDPLFGPVVEVVGRCRIRPPRGSRFASLLSAIVYQQLAGAAARAIHGRVVAALEGEVTAPRVLAVDPEVLRGAGLSRSKLAAILDLAEKSADGTVRLRGLSRMTDEEVVDELTQVRGIGPWTAHMFLMFNLHRPDVWPVGDLGVRQGWTRIHRLDSSPSARELEGAADHLSPWRSAAAWYCWRALEIELPD